MSVSTTADLTRVPLAWIPRQWDFSPLWPCCCRWPLANPGRCFCPALGNSVLVAAGATLVSLLLAIPAAFSFSRYPRTRRLAVRRPRHLYGAARSLCAAALFILEHFGLLNTRSGLVLVYCSLIVPFLTWMVKNQFDTLPQDIEQAARLDGLRIWQVLLRITLPLAKPMLGAAALFGWLLAWDEFFYALLFTSNLAAQTLPVTIAGFTAGRATDDGLVAAVGILASVPPLLIAIWLQKSLVSGLTNGGSKG